MIALDAQRLELSPVQSELVRCTRPGCSGMARRARVGSLEVLVCSQCIDRQRSLQPALGTPDLEQAWERAQLPPRWRGLSLAHRLHLGKPLPTSAERESGIYYVNSHDQKNALLHLHLWLPRGLVVLSGPEGVGKTHLAAGWLSTQFPASNALWLNEEAVAEAARAGTRAQSPELLRPARTVPLLIWDRWNASDLSVSILTARFEACLPTLLTTRLNRQQARRTFREWGLLSAYLREGASRRKTEAPSPAPPVVDGWLTLSGPDARVED